MHGRNIEKSNKKWYEAVLQEPTIAAVRVQNTLPCIKPLVCLKIDFLGFDNKLYYII